jgi:hypothetical protein
VVIKSPTHIEAIIRKQIVRLRHETPCHIIVHSGIKVAAPPSINFCILSRDLRIYQILIPSTCHNLFLVFGKYNEIILKLYGKLNLLCFLSYDILHTLFISSPPHSSMHFSHSYLSHLRYWGQAWNRTA